MLLRHCCHTILGCHPPRRRRRFTATYKLKILEAAAQCTQPGAFGALLRREGLYASHLAAWRTAARRGELAGLAPRRGPTPTTPHPSVKRIAALERDLKRATARAERAEIIVEPKKKVAQLLGLALPTSGAPTETP